MSTVKSYYYWSDTYRNNDGDNLEKCVEKFGTGKQKLPHKNILMEVIFLDEKHSFGYSWCLRCYNKKTGQNVPVSLYEKNPEEKRYGIPPFSS